MKYFEMLKPVKIMTTCWTIHPNIILTTIDTIEDGWHQK